jgi:dipeptidyl aminopeptidase/acylaminoacyl peptidase
LIRPTIELWGIVDFPAGQADLNTPSWSPDGQWIAYRKRMSGSTQVWIVRPDGTELHQVTHASWDIDDFAWVKGSAGLVFAYRPDIRRQRAAIEKEGAGGFLFGKRFDPQASKRPFPAEPVATEYERVDIDTGVVEPAIAADIELLDPAKGVTWPEGADLYAVAANHARAWRTPRDAGFWAPGRLVIESPSGRRTTCSTGSCTGAQGLWWGPAGNILYYLKYDDWARSGTALYAWDRREKAPRRIALMPDLITGCLQDRSALLCVHEAADQPRSIVRLQLTTGMMRPIFDPNPDFASIRLGSVRRLEWTNDIGDENFGYLVLPPDHRPGQKHPLIVVQYEARGFLRGGTGDEFPVYLFAQRGYAVFIFNRPPGYALKHSTEPLQSITDYQRINLRNWQDYGSIHSSLMGGIDAVRALGVVDDRKIGLTGFSAGTTSAEYALIHSDRFAAVSFGTCCDEPMLTELMAGPAWTAYNRNIGYPAFTAENEAFWKPISLMRNAARLHAPVLMQIGDTEYEQSLATYGALRDAHIPTELYVFPDEPHEKSQPGHRRAIYDRNLDWFDFWLTGREDPAPEKAGQYERWERLKSEALSATGTRAP